MHLHFGYPCEHMQLESMNFIISAGYRYQAWNNVNLTRLAEKVCSSLSAMSSALSTRNP
jgi:hypothetical protein